ncbi:Alcohol dehydrogenase [acceptor] [Gracilariopsis chorda]|uniref:Alcohol dehydrogenase [acceptor] n=1 Tax=Gracilariopsis chorda TaxID=448386 RepID=A0A2V3INX6_9FLOR|nr:Alcohol dehydrogenase [acceptor] [Gracilariopsis chorda]|eukprot:PXF43763.1 Alcohol dehydrogenase [acceptor] [Gracilariopsis chorda]
MFSGPTIPTFVPLPSIFHASKLSSTFTHTVSRSHRPAHVVPPTRTPITNAAPADTISETLPRTATSPPSQSFDYVIIGGGAAGCVLANRLSANGKTRVLLLEAGPPDDSFYLRVPLGFPYLLGSKHDWAFVTEPEPHLNGRRLYFPRGKVLGGSHAISVMLYHRGNAADYESWPEGWHAEDVLPYFKRSEGQRAALKQQSAAHSCNGPLAVDDLARVNPMSSAFVDAAVQCGLQRNDDFNDWERSQDGVGIFQVTQRDGNRESPATAYLNSIRARRNLTVQTGVTVERIIFEQGNGVPRASGVSYVKADGNRATVKAEKEVLLSAGVYASPQLLMLSGVGPAEHLEGMGIPIVADVPAVGQNLQDHAAVMLSYESQAPQLDKRNSSVYYTERTGKNIGTILNYIFRGKGPLTSPMCEAGGFVKSDGSMGTCDLQLRFIPFVSEPDPYHSLADFATAGSYLKNESNRPAGFTLQSVAARPRSRGWVSLRSTDVRDSVRIHGNWMADTQDLRTLVQGLKLCREIACQDALKEYRGREAYPGKEVVSDQALEKYVLNTCHTANAMVGTCRMGRGEDCAVDSELRVRGVEGLRVIDSSVMPTLPGGQSGAPTMMIAEKGADLVLQAQQGVSEAVSLSTGTRQV